MELKLTSVKEAIVKILHRTIHDAIIKYTWSIGIIYIILIHYLFFFKTSTGSNIDQKLFPETSDKNKVFLLLQMLTVYFIWSHDKIYLMNVNPIH